MSNNLIISFLQLGSHYLFSMRSQQDKVRKVRQVKSVKSVQSTDNDLCSACHVYPLSHGACIISILFILNRFTWGLNYII